MRGGGRGAKANIGWSKGGGGGDGLVGVDGGDDGLLEVGWKGGDVGGDGGDVIFIGGAVRREKLIDEGGDDFAECGGWVEVGMGGEEGRGKELREGLDVLLCGRREARGSGGEGWATGGDVR